LFFNRTVFVQTREVVSELEFRIEPSLNDSAGDADVTVAQKAENMCVVVLPTQRIVFVIIYCCGTNAGILVDRNGHTDPAAENQDLKNGCTLNFFANFVSKIWVADGDGVIGSFIDSFIFPMFQQRNKGSLELVA